jgi:nucleotide-binding universal stress UspA family protein
MKILYATDGSRGAKAAANLLASLPLGADCQVMIVSVALHPQEERAQAALAAGRAALSHLTANLTIHLCREDPAEAILRAAEEHAVDLVVIGTRGLSALERFFLGSVAERVARHAPCPVLLVRPGHPELRRVIVGVDGSESAVQAVAWLQHLPLPEHCEVRLVTALPPVEELLQAGMVTLPLVSFPEAEAVAKQQQEEAQARLMELAVSFCAAGKRPITDIRRSDPALVLLQTAKDDGADLIVVGSHGLRGVERFLMGSVSEKVLRHGHCSVLVARPRSGSKEQRQPSDAVTRR